MPFVETWERECQKSLARSRARREQVVPTHHHGLWFWPIAFVLVILVGHFFLGLW